MSFLLGPHPAPGLGLLLPGSVILPQNPIYPDHTELVPTPQALAGGNPVYVAHIAELMPASFPVPFNPLKRELLGCGVTGGGMGCLCGCGAGCGCAGGHPMSGVASLGELGAFSLSDITGSLPANWQTYALWGGAALVAWYLISGSRGSAYRRAASEARKEYRSKLAGLRSQYPR